MSDQPKPVNPAAGRAPGGRPPRLPLVALAEDLCDHPTGRELRWLARDPAPPEREAA